MSTVIDPVLKEKFKNNITTSLSVKLANDALKADLIHKYSILADAYYTNNDNCIKQINDNQTLFDAITQDIIIYTIYLERNSKCYATAINNNQNLKNLVNSIDNFKKARTKFCNDYTGELNADVITKLLNSFNVDTADELDEELLEELEGEESNNTETPVEFDNIEHEETEEEIIAKIKETWGPKVEPVVNGIMSSYDKMYGPGYGLIPPIGILTNQGIIKSTEDGKRKVTGSPALDVEIYHNLVKVLGEKYTKYADAGTEPDIELLSQIDYPIIYTDLHLKCMFGHLNFCTGRKNGLRHYLTEHGIKNDSDKKIIKYSSIQGWIRQTIERYFYESYLKMGVTTEINEDTINKVNYINDKISNSLKNVIAVVEKTDKVNTKLRICSDSEISVEQIINTLKNNLNVGSASLIDVQQVGKMHNGVVDINIIYNTKAFSQDSLFAYKVLSILKEQDIKPSWNNVILGKKEDGTIMTYNFKDPNNSVLALYGSKGSGKGVMTLNLIASALADDCTLMYMDAKPDTAIPLCKVVWDKGLDAVVFNGKETPGAGLERGNCPRTVDRFIAKKYIPNGMFHTEQSLEKFILLNTYYRGLELFLELAEDRASIVTNGGHNENWLVAIFDEVQQLAATESSVIEQIEAKQAERKQTKEEVNGKIKGINYMQDPIWKFIEEYKVWRSILKDRLATALGSTFRKAEVTSIYIWQTSDYPSSYVKDSLIAKALMQESGSVVKIMGRGSAAGRNGSKVYGTLSDLQNNTTWYDTRFTGKNGGYWGIGNNVNSDSSMTIFRPFNVYTNADDKQLLITNAEAAGLTEQDLIGKSLNPDGTVIKEIGFEAYSDQLLAMSGKTAAIQLNLGYKRIEQFILDKGLASSVCDYMYNISSCNKNNENNNEYSNGKVLNGVALTGPNDTLELEEETIELANQSKSVFTPVKGMSKSAEDDFRAATAEMPIINKIMSYAQFSKLDNKSKDANLDRINKEMKNKFNTYDTGNNKFGLKHLCWNLSILHSVRMLNTNALHSSIMDFATNYATRLENGTYAYDYIPRNQDEINLLNTHIEFFTNSDGAAMANEGFSNINPNTYDNVDSTVMMDSSSDNEPIYKNTEGRNNIDISRLKVQAIKLDNTNSIDLNINSNSEGANRFKKMLFGTNVGTSYLFTQRTKSVIDAILLAIPDKNAITRLSIKDCQLVVNGRLVDTDPLIDDMYGVRFQDFVIVKQLLEKFSNIQSLVLDNTMFNQVITDYGDDAKSIWLIFQQNKALQRMEIQYDVGSEFKTVTRSDFRQRAVELQNNAKRNKLKQQIETVAATHNPRLADRGIGYSKNMFKEAKDLGGNIFNNLKSNNPSLLRGGLHAALAIGAIGVGITVGVSSRILKLIHRNN